MGKKRDAKADDKPISHIIMVKMRQKACQHNSYRRRQQATIGLIRFADIIQISLWNMRP